MKKYLIALCGALALVAAAALLGSCSGGSHGDGGSGNGRSSFHGDGSGHRSSGAPAEAACTAPGFLVPGDKIALVSTSFTAIPEYVDSAAAVIRSWGFQPVVGPNVGKTFHGAYAGTPAQRAADLKWALGDPSIKAIICNRGGYGAIHLLDLLDESDFRSNPKWLVGYSDVTTLHGMSVRSGVMSIHGAMGVSLVRHGGTDSTAVMLRDLLTGKVPGYQLEPHPDNIPGSATGVLVGGNLLTLTPVLGTWADATAGEDFILFLEEIEENYSHIDRQMNALLLSGVLDRCKGVILGEFTDCEANMEYDSVEQMLCTYLKGRGIPVCCGFPAGHGEVNLPLVMGAPVSLKVTPEGSEVKFIL